MSGTSHDATAKLSLVGAPEEQGRNVYLARSLSGPHRDLLELTARGAPIDQALNAVVRAVAQVRRAETRAAIFLLRGPNDRVLGTFALYHRIPCEPDSADYEEVRYFSNIASLIIERHLDAEARRREQETTGKNLRQSNAGKDAFLATLAHELRNPLGAIKHGLAIIELAADQAATRTRALQAVDRQLEQMEWLVEDLLDANRVTRGDLTLRIQHVDLAAALDLACETVRPLCAGKAQTLTVTTPSQPVYLEADPVRVTQMVTNLLNNACKFAGKDGRIFLEVATEGGDVLIRVRDEGAGIAADQLERVFEMFSQVSKGPGSPHDGLGIGLTLVRSLARMHGGSVAAFSAGIGTGSEFVLRLPLRQH